MRVHDFHRHFGSGPPGSKIHDGKKIFFSEKLSIVGLCAKHEQPIDIRRSDTMMDALTSLVYDPSNKNDRTRVSLLVSCNGMSSM